MLSKKESSALAKQLIDEAAIRYTIAPGQMTLHQDRGSPMTAHGFLDEMIELDITCSNSRPRVRNDNPFSESQFTTQSTILTTLAGLKVNLMASNGARTILLGTISSTIIGG